MHKHANNVSSGGSRKIYLGGLAPHHLAGNSGHRLSKITIEPIKNLGAPARFGGCAPWPQHRTFTECWCLFRCILMISGRQAIREALVTKSVDFADRPRFYFNKLTNPRIKGALLILGTSFAKLHYAYSRLYCLGTYHMHLCKTWFRLIVSHCLTGVVSKQYGIEHNRTLTELRSTLRSSGPWQDNGQQEFAICSCL